MAMFDRLYRMISENKFTYITVFQSQKYRDLREWVLAKTSALDGEFRYTDATRLVWVFAGLTDFPECANPKCGNRIGRGRNVTFNRYYSAHCCNRCLGLDLTSVSKKQATMFRNFGWRKKEKTPSWRELHPDDAYNRARATKTYKEKTGYDWPMQNPEVQDKTKAALLEKYGYDNVGKVPEFHEKTKLTRKAHADKIKESYKKSRKKVEQTFLKKYGCTNAFESPEIRRKIIETNLKRYGVKTPIMTSQIKEAIKNTRMKKYGMPCVPSGRYMYDGMRFDSTAELAFWIQQHDFGVSIERCSGADRMEFISGGHVIGYYPDFKLDGKYIEIKGDQFFRPDGTMFCPYRKKAWTDEQYAKIC